MLDNNAKSCLTQQSCKEIPLLIKFFSERRQDVNKGPFHMMETGEKQLDFNTGSRVLTKRHLSELKSNHKVSPELHANLHKN